VVDIGLFARRNAAVDFMHNFIVDKFKQNPASALIEDLLNGGPIGFILVAFLLDHLFLLAVVDFIVYFMEVDFGVQFGELVLVVKFDLALALGLFVGLSYVVLLFLSLDPSFVVLFIF